MHFLKDSPIFNGILWNGFPRADYAHMASWCWCSVLMSSMQSNIGIVHLQGCHLQKPQGDDYILLWSTNTIAHHSWHHIINTMVINKQDRLADNSIFVQKVSLPFYQHLVRLWCCQLSRCWLQPAESAHPLCSRCCDPTDLPYSPWRPINARHRSADSEAHRPIRHLGGSLW